MLARLAFGNVRKSLRDFGVYFLTVVLGVAVFYAFNSMTAQQGVLAFSETQDRMEAFRPSWRSCWCFWWCTRAAFSCAGASGSSACI